MRSRIRLSSVAFVALAVAACAQPAADTSRSAPAAVSSGGGSPSAPERPIDTGEVPRELLDAIIADAAERADVDHADVEIITAEAVTWSDGALGCPEPGMMYTQALVPGYRVVVRAGAEDLTYHAGQNGDARYCEHPRPPAEGSGSQ